MGSSGDTHRHDVAGGKVMDKWVMRGSAFLVVGLLVLAVTIVHLELTVGRVVARDVALTGDQPEVLGPHRLDGGAYTVWLEDDPDRPRNLPITVNLLGDGPDPVDYLVEGRNVRTIEGVRCVQIGDFDMVRDGEWAVELPDGIPPGSMVELNVFIVSSSGMRTVLALAGAIGLAAFGSAVVVSRLLREPGGERLGG